MSCLAQERMVMAHSEHMPGTEPDEMFLHTSTLQEKVTAHWIQEKKPFPPENVPPLTKLIIKDK